MSAYTITRALLHTSRASRVHGATFARNVARVCGNTSHQATEAIRALVNHAAPTSKPVVTYTVHCKPRCVLQYEAIEFKTVLTTEYVDHGDFIESFVREELVECAPKPPTLICFPTMYTIETAEPVDIDAVRAQDDVWDVTCDISADVKGRSGACKSIVGAMTDETDHVATHEDNANDEEPAIALVVVLMNTPLSGQYELYRVPVGARLILQLIKDYVQLLWSYWF